MSYLILSFLKYFRDLGMKIFKVLHFILYIHILLFIKILKKKLFILKIKECESVDETVEMILNFL